MNRADAESASAKASMAIPRAFALGSYLWLPGRAGTVIGAWHDQTRPVPLGLVLALVAAFKSIRRLGRPRDLDLRASGRAA